MTGAVPSLLEVLRSLLLSQYLGRENYNKDDKHPSLGKRALPALQRCKCLGINAQLLHPLSTWQLLPRASPGVL